MHTRYLPYVWMLFGAASFAVMAVLTSELRQAFSWQWIAAARSGLAMLFAAILVVVAGGRFLVFRPVTLWWRSIAGSVSLLCGFYAMTHYDISVILTLTNMYPIWVAVLSWPLLGVMPKKDTCVAAVIGVIGVAVLAMHMKVEAPGALVAHGTGGVVSTWPARERLDVWPRVAWPIGAALLSAFTSALALLGLHRLRGLDHRAVVVHFSATAFAFCLLAAGMLHHDTLPPPQGSDSWVNWLLLLGVGVSATIGQLLLTKAFAYGDPGRVSVVGLTQICFAMIFEMLWHHRVYSGQTLLGMAMIILPTAWVMWRGQDHTGSTTEWPCEAEVKWAHLVTQWSSPVVGTASSGNEKTEPTRAAEKSVCQTVPHGRL